jgi:hypothetical protein
VGLVYAEEAAHARIGFRGQGVSQKRTLSRTRNSDHHRRLTQGENDIYGLEVVGPGTDDLYSVAHELFSSWFA